jgi:UbiD family decarboxylase
MAAVGYRDMREYLAVLEEHGLLHRVKKEVEKEWEVAAVCRRVFQRIPTAHRPALLFERVKGHDIPIVAGILGASPRVYALALQTTVEGIADRWAEAEKRPISPVVVGSGPVQEHVWRGEAADVTRLPVPTWTVEHDAGPYLTAPCVVTADPDTGERNVGTYRLQVKGPRKLGMYVGPAQHGMVHIRKYEERGEPAPVAVVVGADPTVGLVSVAKVAAGLDEFAVAGGLRGEPLELVRCVTVPLHVPAAAEIVIEGWVPPGVREREGPFGEYTGFMGAAGDHFVVEVSAITHRQHPIYHAFFSQMPPSESSCIRGVGREAPMLRFLRDTMKLPVRDVHFTEAGASAAWVNISVKKTYPGVVSTVMNAAWAYGPPYSKFLVIVDDDIDVRDPFQVQWAMSYCVRPAEDIHILGNMPAIALDPASAPEGVPATDPRRWIGSKVCIDATRKHPYPPKALPPEEHLRRVDERWEEYGFRL